MDKIQYQVHKPKPPKLKGKGLNLCLDKGKIKIVPNKPKYVMRKSDNLSKHTINNEDDFFGLKFVKQI